MSSQLVSIPNTTKSSLKTSLDLKVLEVVDIKLAGENEDFNGLKVCIAFCGINFGFNDNVVKSLILW